MLVLQGKYSGFCFGVKRAIDTVLGLDGENTFVLGEIIHNEQVNEKLKNRGICTIDSLDDERLKSGDTLVIRTHGEPKSTFTMAKEKGLNVIDCTCPFVKEIHNIVESHYSKGYKIAVIGNSAHPEVKGITGWCNGEAYIVNSAEDLQKISAEKLCIVVQTTYMEEKFNEIIKNFTSKEVKTLDIFKTICYTTSKRQKEAEELSAKCDAVIVIGGANSNNTDKLYDICKVNCANTYRVVSPSAFDYGKIKNTNKLGIVLGASTPIEQFQEVISHMENITEEPITTEVVESEETKTETVVANEEVKAEEVVKSEMEKAFDSIKASRDFKVGQIVTAKISSVNENGLTLSLKDTKKDDFEISNDELINEYVKDDIGKSIRVMVVAKNPLRFSEKAMESVLKEEAEIEEIKAGKLFEATITAVNKGGLVGKFGRYEIFVPASQIKLGFVKDLEKYVGKTLRLKAEKVESKGARRQIVGSQRVILEAEKAERDAIRLAKEQEFFANVQEGDIVIGTPVRFANFGAFIDVNGFDCLAHISDLSWTGCKDCSEVLELGKQYEFKILHIDAEKKRVSVGYKQLQAKPWDTVLERYNIGDAIKGKIVRLVSFGAFVEVEKGIDGLVHVSQISHEWLENPISTLSVGQEVDVKILDISPENEKMTLSIKALLPEIEKPEAEDAPAKGKKGKKVEEADENELREWKDDNDGGASIAEIIGENN